MKILKEKPIYFLKENMESSKILFVGMKISKLINISQIVFKLSRSYDNRIVQICSIVCALNKL